MAPRKVNAGEDLSLEEEALVRQWLEYRKIVLDRLNQQQGASSSVCQVKHVSFNECVVINTFIKTTPLALQELNNELASRTYLAGNRCSRADIEVFSGLLDFYVRITSLLLLQSINMT